MKETKIEKEIVRWQDKLGWTLLGSILTILIMKAVGIF